MGADASIPTSEEAAKEAGYTDEQIAEHMYRAKAAGEAVKEEAGTTGTEQDTEAEISEGQTEAPYARSEMQGTTSAAEPDPPSHSTSHSIDGGANSSDGGGGGGGGGGLYGITAVQRAFSFLDGPTDVLSASTACRRWRELACTDLVWRDKAEREGIVDKAAAFEVEVPLVAEGGLLEDKETASMAFYARVFVLKGYMMRDEDYEIFVEGETRDHDGGIRTAVLTWLDDQSAAKAKYGPIASWDVSEVTEMYELFDGAFSFNEDISRWDVSNVVDTSGMFCSANAFNGDLSRWDVSNVENMNIMFQDATAFNGDLSRWDVSNVREMENLFQDATSFNGDLSSWNVSNVESMGEMFRGAEVFNSDLSSWNVSNVGNFESMFQGAEVFNGDLSRWNVSNAKYMTCMFADATSFDRQLDGAWFTSTGSPARGLEEMFRNSPGTIAGRIKHADGTIE